MLIASVVDTGNKHLYGNIENEIAPMKYSGARGTLIHENKPETENLVSDSL
jgi:hypothetical protein